MARSRKKKKKKPNTTNNTTVDEEKAEDESGEREQVGTGVSEGVSMQAGASQPQAFQDNLDSYKEVFQILDEAGLAQLRPSFCKHFVQDKTLSYIETEEELKQLLREIGIPLGMSIPFTKLWNRHKSRSDVPDVTKGTPNSRPVTVDKAVQAVVPLRDACIQTGQSAEMSHYHGDQNYLQAMTAITHYAEHSNQSLPFANNVGFPRAEDVHSNVNLPIGTQQASVSASASYLVTGNQQINFGPGNFPAFVNQYQMNHPSGMFQMQASGANPLGPVSPRGSNSCEKKPTLALSITSTGAKGEIVDECEDFSIQKSLDEFEEMQRELEKQSSYAAALKEHEMNQSAAHDEAPPREEKPSELPSSVRTDNLYQSHFPPPMASQLSPPIPRTSQQSSSSRPPAQSWYQTVPVQHVQQKMSSSQISKQNKSNSSFAKCDDISVEHGVLRKSSSLQNVGSQSLHDYLDMIEESKEYREAMQRGSLKKGWKPLDGKHVASGRKVQFKPMYCDDKGRMCHGVRVRGADKSEECFRHTTGKAPAACSFAHSRLGDTLQFICVKCTCEKKKSEYCADKQKHKQFLFNLGPYRNQSGDVWKQTTPT